jgi:hypothetical protein
MLNYHLLAALAEARTADLHRAAATRRSAGTPRHSRARDSHLRVAIAGTAHAVTRVAKKRPRSVTDTG